MLLYSYNIILLFCSFKSVKKLFLLKFIGTFLQFRNILMWDLVFVNEEPNPPRIYWMFCYNIHIYIYIYIYIYWPLVNVEGEGEFLLTASNWNWIEREREWGETTSNNIWLRVSWNETCIKSYFCTCLLTTSYICQLMFQLKVNFSI